MSPYKCKLIVGQEGKLIINYSLWIDSFLHLFVNSFQNSLFPTYLSALWILPGTSCNILTVLPLVNGLSKALGIYSHYFFRKVMISLGKYPLLKVTTNYRWCCYFSRMCQDAVFTGSLIVKQYTFAWQRVNCLRLLKLISHL